MLDEKTNNQVKLENNAGDVDDEGGGGGREQIFSATCSEDHFLNLSEMTPTRSCPVFSS
jgi:hypothetical protein